MKTFLPAVAGAAVVLALSLSTAAAGAVAPEAAPAHRGGLPDVGLIATPTMPTLAANPTNPLAGHRWGTYAGLAEPSWLPFLDAVGPTRDALAKIATPPKAKWFGSWIPDADIGRKVSEYIDATTHGDPDVVAQLTMARVQPWETAACTRLPTTAEKVSYRRFSDAFVRAIGDARTAVVVEPDGPFARCAPHHSKVLSHLIRQTVHELAALPNTAVYIEMGSADWFRDKPHDAVQLLLDAGVDHARGFALDTTHYDSTARQVTFGTQVVNLLAKQGVADRHFVIDTADNGRGFDGGWFHQRYGQNAILAQAPLCRTRQQSRCVTIGLPPTTDVTEAPADLSGTLSGQAAQHVDGYLWISRPWLTRPGQTWSLSRALQLVRTSPFL